MLILRLHIYEREEADFVKFEPVAVEHEEESYFGVSTVVWKRYSGSAIPAAVV